MGLWVGFPPLGHTADTFRGVMPEAIQHGPTLRCFPSRDLTELRGHVGIGKNLEQQCFWHIGPAEKRDASGESRLGIPLVEKPWHLSSDSGQHSQARSGVLCEGEKKRLIVPGLRVRGHEVLEDIAGRYRVSSHGLDNERIR
jgi:hypothetical protein